MYKTINGFTKAKMIRMIKKNNKGKPSTKSLLSSISGELFQGCAYRSDDGNACAVGCFIPDDMYHSSMENETAAMLLNRFPALNKMMPLSVKGLDMLQTLHDLNSSNLNFDPRPRLIEWIKKNVKDSK